MTAARSQPVDALRGFALFGIILVNAPFFAQPVTYVPAGAGAIDALAFWITNAFGSGKFFLIFSFLFGFGFATILARGEAAPAALRAKFMRRLAALFAIGLLHAVLLFYGDILMLYAVLGLLLWFCRNLRPSLLLWAAAVLSGMAIVAQTMVLQVDEFEGLAAGMNVLPPPGEGYLGGFFEGTTQRIRELPTVLAFIAAFNGPAALAMFLAGLAFGKLERFPLSQAQLDRLTPWAAACAVAGAAGSGLAVAAIMQMSGNPEQAGSFEMSLSITSAGLLAPVLSFGMAVLVLGWAGRNRESPLVGWLAAAGSSSLTGYILHSVILDAVFMGWGLGLYGSLGPAAVLAIAIATFIVMVKLVNIWKIWFRFGPEEWLMRCFIDLAWKPLLR